MPYERGGRERQKARTRQALVDAARQLIERGLTPTVDQAAEAAMVSRTTAYRYFPSQRALLAAAYPFIELQSLLPTPAPAHVAERLRVVVEAHTRQIVANEAALRLMLRLSLEGDQAQRQQLVLRRGRAIGWIAEALEPLRETMGADNIHRLALAIRSVEGIEALVWLTDVGGLSRDAAVAIMRWSAAALLKAALDGEHPPGRV